MAKYLMILGTGSHVGKSILVTALCRTFANLGYRVAPFKAQNMSLNSWITKEGGEIGIAQAIQAKAARVEPSVDMNPVLLKPRGGYKSQVIVLGRPVGDRGAGEYYESTNEMMKVIEGAVGRLALEYDIILIEGAGGAAEINLYERDIVNIGTGRLLKPPIILVGDIERGGVFASIYGTLELLPGDLKPLVRGLIINKFRGNPRILEPGLRQIEELTGIPVLGVIPYADIKIPSEDSVSIPDKNFKKDYPVEIAVIRLPHISNFTDIEPLEPYANIRYVEPHGVLGNPDALIIPGTKNTILDLAELKTSRMDARIKALAGKIPIIGICGGYQILGREIHDEGIENPQGKPCMLEGLGLLEVETRFEEYKKHTKQVEKRITGGGDILGPIKGEKIRGYEIHMGETQRLGQASAFEDDGCIDEKCLIFGTYLHGLFDNENLLEAFLGYLYKKKGLTFKKTDKTDSFEELASLVEAHVDIKRILEILNLDADSEF